MVKENKKKQNFQNKDNFIQKLKYNWNLYNPNLNKEISKYIKEKDIVSDNKYNIMGIKNYFKDLLFKTNETNIFISNKSLKNVNNFYSLFKTKDLKINNIKLKLTVNKNDDVILFKNYLKLNNKDNNLKKKYNGINFKSVDNIESKNKIKEILKLKKEKNKKLQLLDSKLKQTEIEDIEKNKKELINNRQELIIKIKDFEKQFKIQTKKTSNISFSNVNLKNRNYFYHKLEKDYNKKQKEYENRVLKENVNRYKLDYNFYKLKTKKSNIINSKSIENKNLYDKHKLYYNKINYSKQVNCKNINYQDSVNLTKTIHQNQEEEKIKYFEQLNKKISENKISLKKEFSKKKITKKFISKLQKNKTIRKVEEKRNYKNYLPEIQKKLKFDKNFEIINNDLEGIKKIEFYDEKLKNDEYFLKHIKNKGNSLDDFYFKLLKAKINILKI